VIPLFPSNNTGVVQLGGRELTFSYDLVILVGAIKSALDRVGEQVGLTRLTSPACE
jgi:hypothetical protein